VACVSSGATRRRKECCPPTRSACTT
jgi:hypothetical protein